MSEIQVFGGDGVAAVALEREVGTWLATTYPGYAWGVQVSPQQTLVSIRCGNTLSDVGYNLHPHRYPTASLWRAAVLHAGGAVLEAHRLSRRRREHENLPRDARGRLAASY